MTENFFEKTDRKQYIEMNIGVHSQLDGGPFENAEVIDVDLHRETVTIRYSDGYEIIHEIGEVENEIGDEIRADEPVMVSGISSVRPHLTIRLPLAPGYLVESAYGAWEPEELVRWPDERDKAEYEVDEYGGSYGSN